MAIYNYPMLQQIKLQFNWSIDQIEVTKKKSISHTQNMRATSFTLKNEILTVLIIPISYCEC